MTATEKRTGEAKGAATKAATDGKGAAAARPSEQVYDVTDQALAARPAAGLAGPAPSLDDMDEGAAAFEGGETASGVFEGPHWVPHYSQFRDAVIAEKLTKLPPGSSVRPSIGGIFAQQMAWARMVYVLDVPVKGGGAVRVHLPEHGGLYGVLGNVQLGAHVQIVFDGFGTAKPNQSAPVRYRVRVKDKRHLLSLKRPDALIPVSVKDGEDETT